MQFSCTRDWLYEYTCSGKNHTTLRENTCTGVGVIIDENREYRDHSVWLNTNVLFVLDFNELHTEEWHS